MNKGIVILAIIFSLLTAYYINTDIFTKVEGISKQRQEQLKCDCEKGE